MRFQSLPRRPFRPLLAIVAPVLVLVFMGGCEGPDADAHPAPGAGEGGSADAPVVLVTGSTDGLGRELALALGAEGAHVIVHGRNEERGLAVVATIEAGGVGSARFFPADFASLAQVQALADSLRGHYTRLDLLVNNAGVGPGAPGHERGITDDGHELRFQVNYLAGYHLTRELLPLLEAAAAAPLPDGAQGSLSPPRIVNITSRNQQPVVFDDLRMDRGYSGGAAYGRSKLAQILHVQDLAAWGEPRGILAYAVHPAPAMATSLVREAGGTPQSTVAQGLQSVLQAVRTTEHPTGTFFFELEPRRAHEQAYDPDARARLRELSEAMVEAALAPAPNGDAGAAAAGAAPR